MVDAMESVPGAYPAKAATDSSDNPCQGARREVLAAGDRQG